MAYFDGRIASVDVVTERNTMNIYYGGLTTPDGYGAGHVKAVVCDYGYAAITYWRLPDVEGGKVIINNPNSAEALSKYFVDY